MLDEKQQAYKKKERIPLSQIKKRTKSTILIYYFICTGQFCTFKKRHHQKHFARIRDTKSVEHFLQKDSIRFWVWQY
jgi:hypothetical protein